METALSGGKADSASWTECSGNGAGRSGPEDRRGMEAMGAGGETGWRRMVSVSAVTSSVLDMASMCVVVNLNYINHETQQLILKSKLVGVRFIRVLSNPALRQLPDSPPSVNKPSPACDLTLPTLPDRNVDAFWLAVVNICIILARNAR